MNISKEKQNSLRKIFSQNDIIFAYLFGSQVNKKSVTQLSDIDIAVMFNEKINEQERFKKRLTLATDLSRIFNYQEVDLVVLNDQRDILFKFVILQEGKKIYENDHKKLLDYEVKTANDYYDFKPFLEQYNQAFAKKVLAKK